jgi:ribosome-associated protein
VTGRAAKLAAGPPARARKKTAPAVNAPGDARLLDLLERASGVILDKKGYGIKRFDLRPLYAFTDFLLIATGDSTTQNRAMAAGIEERLRLDFGVRPLGIEGAQSGDWVLLDYGGLVINLFTPGVREHFSLERLWADAAPLAESAGA